MESSLSARSSPILDITKFGWVTKSGLQSPSLDIYTYLHYDILSDIMTILDHGNIRVDTIFMIIIVHSFPDIEENLFFENGGPHLHTHNMHIILQHFK